MDRNNTRFALPWLNWMLMVLCFVLTWGVQAQAAEPVKVVYHLSEGVAQAGRAMNNIRNHLSADPTAKIAVVAHGAGIDFMLDGAKNASGNLFAAAIGELSARGVSFMACRNTLEARQINPDQLAMEVKVVPSGVAEVARLQAQQGFVYLKP